MIEKFLDLLIIAVTWIFYALVVFVWIILVMPVLYYLVKLILGLFK